MGIGWIKAMCQLPPPWEREAIERILPHRPPFLLIDQVMEGSAERVVAIKRTRLEEFYFQGHFPGRPVMPGAIQIEIMAQASLILYSFNFEIEHLFFLAKAKAQFFVPVTPDKELRIIAHRTKVFKTMGLTEVEIFCASEKVAAAQLAFSAAGNASEPGQPKNGSLNR
jgi:3-hydroxyacyl-[acyl-carrier-protein] dehydratase